MVDYLSYHSPFKVIMTTHSDDSFEENNLQEQILKKTENKSKKHYIKICFVLFVIVSMYIIVPILIIFWNEKTTHSKTGIRCNITEQNVVLSYPYQKKSMYQISFDDETMQPIFARYHQPYFTNSCTTCYYFRKDPYNISILRFGDFINTGYDPGHLVPNADYGRDTYIVTNVVLMIPNFNRVTWRVNDEMIRDKYKGKLIYKGCEYSDNYINSSRKNKLYIPTGCYYVVFESDDINQINGLELLDFGYFDNVGIPTNVKKLPDWMECVNVSMII